MTTFENIIKNLPSDPNKKGLEFEKICKWYLLNSPFYKKQVKNVWLWSEWKDRWSNQDRGIDLIAETKSGEIWAIQAKAYDSKNQIPKSDIDSFLSESSRSSIDFRLLIATTDKLSAGAKQAIEGQQIPVGLRMLNDLINEDLDWNITKKKISPVIKTPRPHQKTAIRDTIKEFKSNNKGQLIMACGTGKTLTGLWIKESLNADTTLVLLPSISLLSQTLREWLINSKTDFEPFAICSDESVGSNDELYKTYELGIPVTTDKTKIKKFLMSKGKKVVFSTYQSSQRIAEAIGRTKFKFDLIISDEAHRTTGVSSKEFSLILDDKLIPFQHKLFTTATPKILTRSVKSTADERGLVVNSMDDVEIYGPVFHKLDFSEAIDKDLLTDYKVIVVGVDKEEYKKLITKREIVNYEDIATTDAHTLATLIAVLKGIKKYKLKKLITFHSRVKGAKDFSSLIADLISNLTNSNKLSLGFESDFVSGAMPSFERDLKLRNLKTSKNITLLSNARCLSEGVDVPSLDAVVFADPRRSQVDIVQAIGRAIRKSENKKRGILLLPVVIDEDKELEEQLEDSGFKTVWNVINALKSHDSRIEEQLDNFRLRKGARKISKSSSFIDNVEFDLPLKINKDFEKNIKLRVLDAVSGYWFEFFAVLERYAKKHNTSQIHSREIIDGLQVGKWIGRQRDLYKKGLLPDDKIKLIEDTFNDWVWDKEFDLVLRHINDWKKYEKKYDDIYINPSKDRKTALWIQYINKSFREGTLNRDTYLVIRKNFPNYDFKNFREITFLRQVEEYKECIEEYGIENITEETLKNYGKYLNKGFLHTLRLNYKRGTLADWKLEIITSEIPNFIWDKEEFERVQKRSVFEQYVKNYGTAKIPRDLIFEGINLGNWASSKRTKYLNGKITKEEEKYFNKYIKKGWEWTNVTKINDIEVTKQFFEMFTMLKQFYDQNSRSEVSQSENLKLSNWEKRQRKTGLKELDKRLQQHFEDTFKDWYWGNKSDFHWEKNYKIVKNYNNKYGLPPKYGEVYEGLEISRWLRTQRSRNSQNKLSEIRIKKLEILDKNFFKSKTYQSNRSTATLEKQESANREAFVRFLNFLDSHGEWPKNDVHKQGYYPVRYAWQQRSKKRKGTISKEFIDEINKELNNRDKEYIKKFWNTQ